MTVTDLESALAPEDVAALQELDRRCLFHTWGVQDDYDPELIVGAKGTHYWNADGKRYLDFASQMVYANIGHGDERVIEAIAAQARSVATIYGSGKVPTIRLAAKILSLLPPTYGKVFLGSNGSDAVEAALKVARLVTGRQTIVSFWSGYHGSSMGAVSVSGLASVRNGVGGLVPETLFSVAPYHYRSPFGGRTQDETDTLTVAHLEGVIRAAGPESIAAVIGEPVLGSGGGVVPGPRYWQQVRRLCDEYGLLLISDEVVTGWGRTGHWFARDHYDYEPDIICFAKGLSSGYLPVAATVFRSDLVERFRARSVPHGLTYSGHAVCCAAALANIAVLEGDGLVANAATVGSHLATGLRGLHERHPSVGDVRHLGLYAILEFVSDREEKVPYTAAQWPGLAAHGDAASYVAHRMREVGIQTVALRAGGLLGLFPPLTVTVDEVDTVVAALDPILVELDQHTR